MFKNNGTVNDNGMSLVNQGGAKTKNKDHITCYACNKKWYFSNECPTLNKYDKEIDDKNTTNDKTNNVYNFLNSAIESEFFHNYMVYQHINNNSNGTISIPPTWILLDN